MMFKEVKLESELVNGKEYQKEPRRGEESEENRSSNGVSSVLEQGLSPMEDTGISSTPICAPPLSRQFWKAGTYHDTLKSNLKLQNGNNFLHVHPMFLHSNATSHKWVYGAVAELLDNALDEIQNGATFVLVDKISNPRDGGPALLIQDDGGGMDPDVIRRCMSFGFSDKRSISAIGRYGNGFKTSTMRLGADVIVFSRHANDMVLTQSIGLLSYTFLSRTGHNRIVVPLVDYEFNVTTGEWENLHRYGKDYFKSNLSMLLQWSPYSTETELLNQFVDIGPHGTKVIVYNLWLNDDGDVELDFDADPEDVRIRGDIKTVETRPAWRTVNEQHLAYRLHYSLRVYLSILYLRVPETFRIILRGKVVEHHNLADDLKFPEYILYRPQTGGSVEGQVVTTIGFLKEAPRVHVHGFNVYHKNRLILPFWQVVSFADSRGRGVVGILEANFVEPTHNKQDFERTSLFQKLEQRLKEMTWEYWDYHCGLIGYQVKKKPQAILQGASRGGNRVPVALAQPYAPTANVNIASTKGIKRKEPEIIELGNMKRQGGPRNNAIVPGHDIEAQPVSNDPNRSNNPEITNLIQENKKLLALCSDHEKRKKELEQKASELKAEIGAVQQDYDRLMAELAALDAVKEERT